MKTSYYTINDQILGERTSGRDRINYVFDALGSVTGTLAVGELRNIYIFEPYGNQLSKTGADPDPAFKWVGSKGYRPTGRKYGEIYVRARNYATLLGRWISRDLLWPTQAGYGYANCNPLTYSDPTGDLPCIPQEDHGDGLGKSVMCLAAGSATSKDAVKWAADWGKRNGFQKGNEPCPDGTLCNAIQHCMWACLLTQMVDASCAQGITDMHEADAPFPGCPGYRPVPKGGAPNPLWSKNMDLYNNGVGIACGGTADCGACCTNAARLGKLAVNIQPPAPWKPSKHYFPKPGPLIVKVKNK